MGSRKSKIESRPAVGGLAGWLFQRMRGAKRAAPRLALLERITVAPRQTLALVEAEGRKFLVATSADGSPAFCELRGLSGDRASRVRASW
jgi:hypothetical protein